PDAASYDSSRRPRGRISTESLSVTFPPTLPFDLPIAVQKLFASQGRRPFPFQLEAWHAYLTGRSGLINAPTGLGNTLAAWMGAVIEGWLAPSDSEVSRATDRRPGRSVPGSAETSSTLDHRPLKAAVGGTATSASEPIRVLWVTPLRALAADTTASL